MKKIILSLMITLFIGLNALTAQVTISAKDFASLQKSNKALVVIDATKAATYAKMHIMKSVNVPYADLNKTGDIAGLIKSPAEIAAYLGKKGITAKSEIVVYDEGSNKYASRVYWVLKYVGAENVKILHKDMNQWKGARLRLTKSATPVKAATFTANVNAAIYADMAEVIAGLNKSDVVLVDCRAANEFDGSVETSKGHLPGAVHIEYKDVLKANGAFKSKEALKELADKHGITADKKVVLYCATSVRAAVSYVAFKNILGLENVKVYDGAYNEWVATASNKID
jgi:thiosulfate/3-mercaptopyruvate sulfurtransferase